MRTGDGDVMYQSVYVVVGALVLSSFLFSTFRFALLGLFSAWFGTDLVPCRYVLEFRAVPLVVSRWQRPRRFGLGLVFVSSSKYST